jgi:hypothetical protein
MTSRRNNFVALPVPPIPGGLVVDYRTTRDRKIELPDGGWVAVREMPRVEGTWEICDARADRKTKRRRTRFAWGASPA